MSSGLGKGSVASPGGRHLLSRSLNLCCTRCFHGVRRQLEILKVPQNTLPFSAELSSQSLPSVPHGRHCVVGVSFFPLWHLAEASLLDKFIRIHHLAQAPGMRAAYPHFSRAALLLQPPLLPHALLGYCRLARQGGWEPCQTDQIQRWL